MKPQQARNGLLRIVAIIAAGSLASLAATLGVAAPADAYTLTGCHWPATAIQINYQNVPAGNYVTAINAAAGNYYSNTDAKVTTTLASGPSFTAKAGNYGADGYEGYTNWVCPFGSTTSADARLNSYYLSGAPVARLKVVWLHEIGHGLGLNHVSGTGYVMYSSASVAYNNGVRSLTFDEVAGINSLY